MALRNIIQIDEELCDGCGECVPSCAEGALQIIGGKARLVSDVLCDGLGACLGECPTGALTVIQRDADEFDEHVAMAHVAASAPGSIRSPLRLAAQAPHENTSARVEPMTLHTHGGCPGSRVQSFDGPAAATSGVGVASITSVPSTSALRQWPVQLHLVPPVAPFFDDKDVLLAADCVPVTVGDFHASFLAGRGLAIACPKLDQHQEVYIQKLTTMIDEGNIRSLTVAIMEVPCCGGLVRMVQQAMAGARRRVPLRIVTVGTRGQILGERVH